MMIVFDSERCPAENPDRHDDNHLQENLRQSRHTVEVRINTNHSSKYIHTQHHLRPQRLKMLNLSVNP